jgi:YHS domain-containing protein
MSKVHMQTFHPNGQEFEIDLVCGMKVDSQNPPFQILIQKKKYYFCSQACKYLFEHEPEKYIKPNEP